MLSSVRWDVVVVKCLSVVLAASLGCRSGDVTRSLGYTGTEYLQWRHIDLPLRRGPEYLNLQAIVTLEFQKDTSALQLGEVEARFLVAQASLTMRDEAKKRLFICA